MIDLGAELKKLDVDHSRFYILTPKLIPKKVAEWIYFASKHVFLIPLP